MNIKHILSLLTLVALLASCGGDVSQPKPQTYLRIDLPEHNYTVVDTVRLPDSGGGKTFVLPYHLEMNTLATVSEGKQDNQGTGIVINYAQWNADMELFYLPLGGKNNLNDLMRDVQRRLEREHQKADAPDDIESLDFPENHVQAIVWHINGRDVACTYMFIATDSTDHALFGSFIINQVPDKDLLSPVLDYLQADASHLLQTLRWK